MTRFQLLLHLADLGRSGFVTEASRQGVALPAIMQLTEHRSVSSVIGYFQTGGASANPAGRLLEDWPLASRS